MAELLAFEVERARAHYRAAAPASSSLPLLPAVHAGRLRAVRGILDEVERAGYQVLAGGSWSPPPPPQGGRPPPHRRPGRRPPSAGSASPPRRPMTLRVAPALALVVAAADLFLLWGGRWPRRSEPRRPRRGS